MSEVEEFGIEAFGEPVASDATTQTDGDIAALKELIDDLTKQAAETFDELERQRIRNAKKAAEDQLSAMVTGTQKTEKQWSDLALAYKEVFGNAEEFKSRLAALGGVSDESFESLRHQLAEHHAAAKPKGRGGRRKKAETEAPIVVPNSRFLDALKHAANLGLSGQAIWDELGLADLTDSNIDTLVAEINKRANSGGVEEFGLGESSPETVAPPASQPPSAGVDTSNAAENAPVASTPVLVDNKLIDPETGEVLPRSWFLEALGLAEMPTKPDKEIAAKILDIMHTRYIDPAARYRAQAEKMAAPLEAKAKLWEEVFGDYLDKCGETFLPKVQKVDSPNFGKYSKKTLDLPTGSVSWKKDGGIVAMTDAPAFFAWLTEKKQQLLTLREQGTPEALEEIKALEESYGLRLKTEAEISKDKLAKLPETELPPGYSIPPVNEFFTRTIK